MGVGCDDALSFRLILPKALKHIRISRRLSSNIYAPVAAAAQRGVKACCNDGMREVHQTKTAHDDAERRRRSNSFKLLLDSSSASVRD